MKNSSVLYLILGVFESTKKFTHTPLEIDSEKGYFVTEIADELYWLIADGYRFMFLIIYEGVIVVDAQAQTCANLTLEKWNDRLRELEPLMEDHCMEMVFYVAID